MATKTTNYNLTKPAYDEDADINVINDNMDIIDAKMKEIEDAGGGGAVDAYTKKQTDNLLLNKVDKVDGKGLSTNDFEDGFKNKLNGIEEGANKTTIDSELSTTSENPVQNKVITNKINEINSNLENTNSLNIKYYDLGTVTMLEALESIFQELYAYKYKLYICRVRAKDTPTLHIYITRCGDFGICFGVSEQNGKCYSYFRNSTNNIWVRTNAFG